jgi:catalase (peroxidase I)
MNATKIMLCAIGATVITSATVCGAMARPVEAISASEPSVSEMLSGQPELVGTHAAIDSRSSASGVRLALNPQPLPPGIVDDDRDW